MRIIKLINSGILLFIILFFITNCNMFNVQTEEQFNDVNNINIKSKPKEKITKDLSIENFGSGSLTTNYWVLGGNQVPYIQSWTYYSWRNALQFGSINDRESSSATLNVTCSSTTTMTFYCKVSSEQDYDYFELYDNDVGIKYGSGEINWTFVSVSLTQGDHALRFQYIKDNYTKVNSDTAWVDDISFSPSVKVFTFK